MCISMCIICICMYIAFAPRSQFLFSSAQNSGFPGVARPRRGTSGAEGSRTHLLRLLINTTSTTDLYYECCCYF